MKISKDKLKTIIKEELEHGSGDNYEGSMAKENLFKIAKYARNMMDLIGDGDDLEPWLEEKIAVASYIMDTVGHHLEYKAEVGGGHEDDEMMGGESPEEDDGGEEAYVISIGDEDGMEHGEPDEDNFGGPSDDDADNETFGSDEESGEEGYEDDEMGGEEYESDEDSDEESSEEDGESF